MKVRDFVTVIHIKIKAMFVMRSKTNYQPIGNSQLSLLVY